MAKLDVVLALKLVAAKAEKMANDYDRGMLWPGELNAGIGEIEKALTDAKKNEETHG